MIDLSSQPSHRERIVPAGIQAALERVHEAFWCRGDGIPAERSDHAAFCAALPLERLGDRTFRDDHGLRCNCVGGAMANGIASEELVEALSHSGYLGFFGAAGLPLARIEAALVRLQERLHGQPFGANLIHSPNEPRHEAAVAELFQRRKLRLVEASAYLDLTLPLVRYRLAGLHVGPDGRLAAPNHVVAKVSRVEVATKFMSPAPGAMLRQLINEGSITPQQAEWAQNLPVAQDVTAEADSAGHTDNRPALTLLPTLLALRDRLQAKYEYDRPLRIGAAGGIATPQAVAAAFAMGAAYIVTGSVNQACVESGTSDVVRALLAQAEQADTCMAPAADMFEMGVKVQVLKRGTLFAMRATKLYELYRQHDSLEGIPAAERANLERTLFQKPLMQVWAETEQFFSERDPRQLELAAQDGKHRMALVFRWYLGQSSRWANAGVPNRTTDFQIWCGPAMGAFNEWTRGTFLERPEERRVSLVAANLLFGAALVLRAHQLRLQGVRLPAGTPSVRPLSAAELAARIDLGSEA